MQRKMCVIVTEIERDMNCFIDLFDCLSVFLFACPLLCFLVLLSVFLHPKKIFFFFFFFWWGGGGGGGSKSVVCLCFVALVSTFP